MSDQLPHDEELRSLYRRLPADEPRAEIDEAILAEARKVAEAAARSSGARGTTDRQQRHRRRFLARMRWVVPLAAAASVILTFSLARLTPERPAVPASVSLDERSGSPSPQESARDAIVPTNERDAGEKEAMLADNATGELAKGAPAAEPEPPESQQSGRRESFEGRVAQAQRRAKGKEEAGAREDVAPPQAAKDAAQPEAGDDVAARENGGVAQENGGGARENGVTAREERAAAAPPPPAALAPAAPGPPAPAATTDLARKAPSKAKSDEDLRARDAAEGLASEQKRVAEQERAAEQKRAAEQERAAERKLAESKLAAEKKRPADQERVAGQSGVAARQRAPEQEASAELGIAASGAAAGAAESAYRDSSARDWPFGLSPRIAQDDACRLVSAALQAGCRFDGATAVVEPKTGAVIDRGDFAGRRLTRIELLAENGKLARIVLRIEGFASDQILIAPPPP